ncbi:type I-E CRISPR-associated protein Cas6/Cse3/CasE [Cryobacterium frigoriphilum]|uniref:Type I-E CRISPR-associated protein Cas6/Cse3/CasE n=1 Tax=Cryobacterium frigoriphilum TaxID=1259150 RepID=A0A4R8ZU34_9MICO|nr:type I-E CRISPR-associated protein Cas6/Cse3/CasE [Cryobacterium frigoriphilum]TFD45940.1 type I-E CRISPR-associated protein Cas6/Cse3/CasE [Cryobacterium frigoriphilum]
MNHLTLVAAPTVRVKSWSDHGELHRLVMAMFQSANLPGEPNEKRAASNILFRIDEAPTGKVLLIRSDIAPTNLPRGAKTKAVPWQMPEAGAAIRFRLTANAIRRTRPVTPAVKRGVGMSPVDDVADWMTNKLAGALDDVTLFSHDRSVVTSGKSPLQLDAVDGYALVHDPEAVQHLLKTGVGRSKAFGCGLLTIARA